MFSEQLSRIRTKLNLAKAKDPELKVFGADGHEYELNAPANINDVRNFEHSFGITLPADYVEFITTICNGGPGPYYGIYELGDFGYMTGCEKTMANPCLVDSKLTEARWKKLTAFEEKMDSSDDRYYRYYDKLFAGQLPIGHQGCNFNSMLILNGEYAGRVLNIDQDLQIPNVAKEKNFLDWYEGWLDEVLK